MGGFQPWQDTYCLLAGTRIARSTRPSERLVQPANDQPQKPSKLLISMLITRMLVKMSSVLH